MRKAILGAASALALSSPAVAADLPVTPYSENPAMSGKSPHTRTGLRGLSLSRSLSHIRTVWFAGLSL